MSTLYLARHGRSLGQGLFLGRSDPGLSEEGLVQSRALADALAGEDLAGIACSTLRRSMETAAVVAERLHLPLEPDESWNEIGYGLWDGLSWDEIEQRWPEQSRRKLASWWSVTPEGGETREDFLRRVQAAWNGLRGSAGNVLLVGHAGVNGLLTELCRNEEQIDWDRVTRFQQAYGDVLRIEMQ